MNLILWYRSQRGVHPCCNMTLRGVHPFCKYRMTLTWTLSFGISLKGAYIPSVCTRTKNVKTSSCRDRDFPVIVRTERNNEMMEVKVRQSRDDLPSCPSSLPCCLHEGSPCLSPASGCPPVALHTHTHICIQVDNIHIFAQMLAHSQACTHARAYMRTHTHTGV